MSRPEKQGAVVVTPASAKGQRRGVPIPTLGYPSQKDAVVSLYEQRVEPRQIAKRTGINPNSVHRYIHQYRVATGRYVVPDRITPKAEPIPLDGFVWGMDEDDRRMAVYRRAVTGARRALRSLAK